MIAAFVGVTKFIEQPAGIADTYCCVASQLPADLKEAQGRLRQTSHNSSRLQSNEMPWGWRVKWVHHIARDIAERYVGSDSHSDAGAFAPPPSKLFNLKQSRQTSGQDQRKPDKQAGTRVRGRSAFIQRAEQQAYCPRHGAVCGG